MRSNRNIVLVGFMGTGKSSVGKRVAQRLDRLFVDMDEWIEEWEKRSISDIFREEGEAYFRQRERELVQELATREGLVIAAGGGVVLDPDNIQDLSRNGIVVCLTATSEVIIERTARESHRPLLEEGKKAESIKRVLSDRASFYDSIPHQIDTTGLTLDEVVARIIALSDN